MRLIVLRKASRYLTPDMLAVFVDLADRDPLSVYAGRRYSPVYPMMVNLVVLCNAVSFFGKELGNRRSFTCPYSFLTPFYLFLSNIADKEPQS